MQFVQQFLVKRLRPLGVLCLAALLAFAQQQAVVHLLGHAVEQIALQDRDGRTDTPSDAPEALCAKCLALAHFDHVVDTPVHALAAVESVYRAIDVPSIARVDLASSRPYESRAPPTIS